MARKSKATNEAGSSSGLLDKLREVQGNVGKLDPAELDGRLLWKAVVLLAGRSASIQIGVTRDGTAWAVQYWDGKFPLKEYYRSTQELNRSLAALIRAGYGKLLDPEWEKIVQEYGW